ncbi:MAG: insulinase family protein [Methylobacteriaceae bacterium]|nr:insulinase family protein [Methylobacteriaceae bacterium]
MNLPQAAASPQPAASGAHAGPHIAHSRLDNGMEVVVIPDHRAPVVTHMVWYRNGSADDPPLKSGIAHFLEHLMFKGTKNHPQGEFSSLVSDLGGQENAFTGHDYTSYFQRVPREHLGTMMEYEADRMTNLVLSDEVVAPERDVVLEERRMRTDSDPSAELSEAVQAALFAHHPYGTPIIGWGHEIETLGREDALAYYERFYTPENAILVVAGDVQPADVEKLARETYGRIPARGAPPVRRRPQEPPARARRHVSLADEKVEQPTYERVYVVPSARTAEPGEAEALEVMSHLLGAGQSSRLYKQLVIDKPVAVAAGAYYMSSSLDATRLWVYGVPAEDVSLDDFDVAIDGVIADFIANPPGDKEFERAKTRLVADAVYAQDSQVALARWYGAALAIGETIEDVSGWTARIEAVTPEAVVAAARKWLDKRRAVTGYLLPEATA